MLTRDPEITNLIGSSDDDLLYELIKEKAEAKLLKKEDLDPSRLAAASVMRDKELLKEVSKTVVEDKKMPTGMSNASPSHGASVMVSGPKPGLQQVPHQDQAHPTGSHSGTPPPGQQPKETSKTSSPTTLFGGNTDPKHPAAQGKAPPAKSGK